MDPDARRALRWVAVGGSVVEFLIFGAFGAQSLLSFVAINARGDGLANDLNLLAAVISLGLAAGFGLGASMLTSEWFQARIAGARVMGAVLHLGATVLATWAALWMGMWELRVDPTTPGAWSPWIAFAIAALLIVTGAAVVGLAISLAWRR